MAEAPGFDIRRVLLLIGVILVLLISVVVFFLRGCAPNLQAKKAGSTVIYSNLELKDSANVIARLKELNIPYEIKDNGRSIAVPKEKADQARISLAEKNLPAGGAVGWEIFDQSKLGATDFDRRIQLIRAISGELSRTIRQIEGIDNVRVQIVIPETKLFSATSAPVTASVLLRLKPGSELNRDKINGIVHLVASSVENLQTENVTVIDDTGKILTAKGSEAENKIVMAPPPASQPVEITRPEETVELSLPTKEVVLKKPVKPEVKTTPTPEAKAKIELTQVPTLTAEEKILFKAKAKKDLEQEFSGKAQELLNRFYPPNSAIVKVAIDIKPIKGLEVTTKDLKIKKITVIVLIDNRVSLNKKLKVATYSTIAAAVGYNKKRGDKIILQSVPFHLAVSLSERGSAEAAKIRPTRSIKTDVLYASIKSFVWLAGVVLLIGGVVWLLVFLRKKRTAPALSVTQEPEPTRPASAPAHKVSLVEQVRSMAENNPEKMAELLRGWLSE